MREPYFSICLYCNRSAPCAISARGAAPLCRVVGTLCACQSARFEGQYAPMAGCAPTHLRLLICTPAVARMEKSLPAQDSANSREQQVYTALLKAICDTRKLLRRARYAFFAYFLPLRAESKSQPPAGTANKRTRPPRGAKSNKTALFVTAPEPACPVQRRLRAMRLCLKLRRSVAPDSTKAAALDPLERFLRDLREKRGLCPRFTPAGAYSAPGPSRQGGPCTHAVSRRLDTLLTDRKSDLCEC